MVLFYKQSEEIKILKAKQRAIWSKVKKYFGSLTFYLNRFTLYKQGQVSHVKLVELLRDFSVYNLYQITRHHSPEDKNLHDSLKNHDLLR